MLTGVVAALVGQGLEVGEAARAAVYLHGLAGDLAAGRLGPGGVTASDVLEAVPAAYSKLLPP